MEESPAVETVETAMEESPAVEQESGDLDGDVETVETGNPNEDQYIPGSKEIHPGGIKMKAKSLAYLKEEKSNPYIARVNAATLEKMILQLMRC